MLTVQIDLNVNAAEVVVAMNNLAAALSTAKGLGLADLAISAEKAPARRSRAKVAQTVEEVQEVPEVEEVTTVGEPEVTTVGELTEVIPESEVEQPQYTMEQVRAKLSTISRAGKAADVKTLINSLGAENLTKLSPDKYAEVMEKAEAL